jgi:hypothetical protein
MKRMLLGLAAFALVSAAAAPAFAWDELGRRNVADRTDRDSIQLSGHRMLSRIRICVGDRPVRFYDVGVVFNNGGRQDVQVRARLPAGACTRAIELDGAPRDVSEISFVYEAITPRRRVRSTSITVWGE